ncbi:MAG: AAA family ATPase [bacterium]
MSKVHLSILGDCIIDVDGTQVTPAAPHLFALLLILALERERKVCRSELQILLFEQGIDARQASHNLRQLLYRLRRMGLQIDDGPSGMSLTNVEVLPPMHCLEGKSIEERAVVTRESLQALPSYTPRLSKPFAEWIEQATERINDGVRSLLLSDLRALRSSRAWLHTSRLAATLLLFDPLNEEAVIARAEALAMLGDRDSALDALDAYMREADGGSQNTREVRSLRARIARRSPSGAAELLLGRTTALEGLESEWNRAQSGGGARLHVIIGAPGIGKTRLLQEFSATIGLRRAHVIHHRCDSQSRAYPLSLFSQILPNLRAMRGSLGASPQYTQTLDLLRPSLDSSQTAIPEGLSIEAVRAEVQFALVDLMEAVSCEQPILLAVDDAHLLDDASVSMLRVLSTSANAAELLIVACSRPSSGPASLLERGQRATSQLLSPLNASDSRALLLALATTPDANRDDFEWCLAQSGGNPFYIHALAKHDLKPPTLDSVPFDLHSLASSSYFALRSPARLVLESCLVLGLHATIGRVGLVSGLDELELVSALRELEEQDLIRFGDDRILGPHSLLHDALRGFVPTTVRALLNKRGAQALAEECMEREYSTSLALAAADCWIAAGDVLTALGLLRRCASEAASIGEPAAAAELLSRMVHASLPLTERRSLLDDIVRYASTGGSPQLAADSLRERLAVARALNEPSTSTQELEFRIIETDMQNEVEQVDAVDPLLSLLNHTLSSPGLRDRILVRLMMIADGEFDVTLAKSLYEQSLTHDDINATRSASKLIALLVYHTTFGSRDRACALADELLARYPVASLDELSLRARYNALFALYRLRRTDTLCAILEAEYRFMATHDIRSAALHAASLLMEVTISVGDMAAAVHWLAASEELLCGATVHKLAPHSGHNSSAALLATLDGHFEVAEKFNALLRDESRMKSARFEAICLSLRLRVFALQGSVDDHKELSLRLRDLYERGRRLGGQDVIVEVLWRIEALAGNHAAASQMLSEYLSDHRRELGPPEWLLRVTTSADAAWKVSKMGQDRRADTSTAA